jgi:hypothetical protein
VAVLPSRDRAYLEGQGIPFTEHDGPQKAIVFPDHPLPVGRFDAPRASILILLPAGYPDSPPDMFFALPWIRLVPGGRFPRAADQPFVFEGQSWQRWSRHSQQWRPGIDGIWTMLRRVDVALESAA